MRRAISKAAPPFEVDCLPGDCSCIYVYTDGTEMKSSGVAAEMSQSGGYLLSKHEDLSSYPQDLHKS